MPAVSKCAGCGVELSSETSPGLCPQCLIKGGSESSPQGATHPPPEKTMTISEGGVAEQRKITNRFVRYFGDYELLEEIAHGGMGVVFKARQVSLNRLVAVKMIRAGHLASDAEIKRFHTEAEAAANLQHANIVAIHEVGEHEGQQYFSMDYVEGKNLSEMVQGKPLPAARAARYVKTMAAAIQYAHQRGILHRDLKPQNVLIDANDQPRITDFGLAKQMARDTGMTVTGAVMGTPAYMAPEQAAGQSRDVSPASDVYSLGAILYELLTGRPPFRGETTFATLVKVIEEEPVSPKKLNPLVPPDLETICLKCLDKRPGRRYFSARALAEELQRFLDREPILARPSGAFTKTWRWAKRHPWLLIGFLSLALLGLFCLAYGLWQKNRYLAWSLSHPGEIASSRGRSQQLDWMMDIEFWVYMCVFWAYLNFERQSRRVTWGQTFERPRGIWKLLPILPMNPRFLIFYTMLSVLGIVYAIFLITQTIGIYVWEKRSGSMTHIADEVLTYCTIFISCLIIRLAMRQYKINQFGSDQLDVGAGREPGPLPPEQLCQVSDALFAGQKVRAIKLYRIIRQASFSEAKAAVERLAAELYEQQPEKFIANPQQTLELDYSFLFKILAVGCVVLAGSYFLLPADWRRPFLLSACIGWLWMGGVVSLKFGSRRRWAHLINILGSVLLYAVGVVSFFVFMKLIRRVGVLGAICYAAVAAVVGGLPVLLAARKARKGL